MPERSTFGVSGYRERLRYGLRHDERAKYPQPVASRLGPRFYDWQLAQTAEESWCQCRLHARNLLGKAGYRQLLAENDAEGRGEKSAAARHAAEPSAEYAGDKAQGTLSG